ncbi:GDSL esterase/lipase At4g16230-like isoform X3 [Prunus avium]|uniref:GDSL esterase/lipase At4g16230-like isoform X3 n=1 Tax=Prunus avium TaxID=42229 RepID=A0A6P5S511_PRUAV|nr:GDSL esterase/lipase At4g16230-like isoform X3 [Prunus avium]
MGIIFQILVVYFLLLVSCSANKSVPAFFTFGDSLVDVGNNNYLQTVAKELGFVNFTPPYLAPTTVGDVLLQGVNYASSGSGILNSTGSIFGDRINFDTQISNHGRTVRAIMSRIGIPAAQKLLRRAIYGVATGSNDIMVKESAPAMSEEAFLDLLISRLKLAFTTLYNLNARKIIVTNAGPCGCIPFEKDIHPLPKGSCVRLINRMAHTFNDKLKGMLAELNKELQGAKFIYVDIYRILLDLTQNYVSYGFENATSACCSFAGSRGGLVPCNPLSKICPDRSKYVFWDPYHLTDAANVIAVRHMMDGGLNYMSPMNFRQLVQS